MTYLYANGKYRIYEGGRYLGALHSLEAAETYIAACLPVAAPRNGSQRQERKAA